jgi:hypothetical protein
MEIKDHWVEKEMEEILKERKNMRKSKRQPDLKCWIFFFFTAICLLCVNLHGSETNQTFLAGGAGVSWRCSACGNHCWSNAKDWKGDYYCNACGKKR